MKLVLYFEREQEWLTNYLESNASQNEKWFKSEFYHIQYTKSTHSGFVKTGKELQTWECCLSLEWEKIYEIWPKKYK